MRGCFAYLPPTNRCCLSEASTLTASGDGLTGHKGGLARPVGLERSNSWSQTLGIRTFGTLRKIKGAPACCGEFVPTAGDKGIEADVSYVPLASEPTSQGLDRHRTGHYGHRAGVGSIAKAIRPRLRPGWRAGWTQHVDVCQRVQARLRRTFSARKGARRSGQSHRVGAAGV